MPFILTGSISFIFLFLFDYYSLKNHHIKKRIFGLLGLFLMIYSTAMVIVTSERISFSITVRSISAVLCAAAVFLLMYSLFLELPFMNIYVKQGHHKQLVDIGTYALCRHPGVLWFGFVFLFSFITTGALLLMWAGIIWTSINIVYVYLQEKLFFYKMFSTYHVYVKTTPMLIPTKASIKKCTATLFKIGEEKYE